MSPGPGRGTSVPTWIEVRKNEALGLDRVTSSTAVPVTTFPVTPSVAIDRTKVGILSLGSDVAVDRWTDHMAENVERMTLVARLCAAYLAMAKPLPLPQPLSLREVQCFELLG